MAVVPWIAAVLAWTATAAAGGGAAVGAASGLSDVHVTMFSDRALEAAAVLESVCRHAAAPERLVFHVVVSARGGGSGFEAAARGGGCARARLRVHALGDLTRELRDAGVVVTWEMAPVARTNLTVRAAAWDASDKHKTGFNHLRFYAPYLSPFRNLDALIFLDDDTIVQGDIADLHGFDLGGKAIGAGCLNWVWNSCERMESSLSLTYADVPYFGVGTLTGRSVADATCGAAGETECVPEGFFESLSRASRELGGGGDVASAFRTSRAWNFGLNKFDLAAWRRRGLTEKYVGWMAANAREGWFPETSLGYGLGVAFLAWAGDVACVDDALPISHGLGFVPYDDFAVDLAKRGDRPDPAAALARAYAVHWNGDRKPWDPDRSIRGYEAAYHAHAAPEIARRFEGSRRLAGPGAARLRPFVVLSAPRSGTEWFMDVLDRHPAVCATGVLRRPMPRW